MRSRSSLLTPIANVLEVQKRRTLAVISSVAGDRGQPSNYLYGSAKAALSAFLEGLRTRFFNAGVDVVTIKLGFVATPMTAWLRLPKSIRPRPFPHMPLRKRGGVGDGTSCS